MADEGRTWVIDALASERGFFVNGWTNDTNTVDDEVYYRLDRNGDVLRGIRYGEVEGDEQIRSLVALPGGRVLALGNSGNDDRAMATALSADGDLLWRRSLRYADASFNIFTDAVVGADGDYYLSGVSLVGSDTSSVFMTRVSPAGELVATYRYASAWERPGGATRNIVRMPGGRFVVVAPHGSFGDGRSTVLYTVNSDGEIQSAAALRSSGPISIRDVALTGDGNYLLVGTVFAPNQEWRQNNLIADGAVAPDRNYGVVVEMSPAGNLVRQRTVGLRASSRLSAVAPAPGGGYWVAGSVEQCEGAPPGADFLLAYLDASLASPDACEPGGAPTVTVLPQASPGMETGGALWEPVLVRSTAAPPVVEATGVATPYRCPEAVTASAPEPVVACAGEDIDIDVTTPGVETYLWSDGLEGAARTVPVPSSMAVTLLYDCESVELPVVVEGEACCRVYVPTAFSPDGDGVNDVFSPAFAQAGCRGVGAYELRVFDRWGGLVFASSEPAIGWDGRYRGRALGNGVYVYTLRYFDGVSEVSMRGSLGLLR